MSESLILAPLFTQRGALGAGRRSRRPRGRRSPYVWARRDTRTRCGRASARRRLRPVVVQEATGTGGTGAGGRRRQTDDPAEREPLFLTALVPSPGSLQRPAVVGEASDPSDAQLGKGEVTALASRVPRLEGPVGEPEKRDTNQRLRAAAPVSTF